MSQTSLEDNKNFRMLMKSLEELKNMDGGSDDEARAKTAIKVKIAHDRIKASPTVDENLASTLASFDTNELVSSAAHRRGDYKYELNERYIFVDQVEAIKPIPSSALWMYGLLFSLSIILGTTLAIIYNNSFILTLSILFSMATFGYFWLSYQNRPLPIAKYSQNKITRIAKVEISFLEKSFGFNIENINTDDEDFIPFILDYFDVIANSGGIGDINVGKDIYSDMSKRIKAMKNTEISPQNLSRKLYRLRRGLEE